uniref:putative uncharacterized protein FLJ33534 n=1 Tax=Macaca mulatta TaxID=9544 RepID=UPI0003AB6B5D|nr:putative uncharacterized protein FLJ33534 [Macaca fascicularis]XP_011747677.1 putative uncharacterized protein FLJ33534 [Macaca nemestrina]XP_028687805.1 putative uncharacterized protein FLJ33534 [Macaca mulatta]
MGLLSQRKWTLSGFQQTGCVALMVSILPWVGSRMRFGRKQVLWIIFLKIGAGCVQVHVGHDCRTPQRQQGAPWSFVSSLRPAASPLAPPSPGAQKPGVSAAALWLCLFCALRVLG